MAERAKKRSKKQQVLDVIAKHYSQLSEYSKAKNKVEKVLDTLELALIAEKENKKPSVKRLINGKSKEQIQALIEALQAEL